MQAGLNDQSVNGKIHFSRIALLMVLALALRIPTLNMGIWLDECITIFVCTQPTVQDMLSNLVVQDFNPPISHFITRAFISLFGTGEITVRIPSLIFGIFLVPAMYWLGRVTVSARVGLWCAFFVALSPIANYFACQARPYSLGLLSGALMTAFFCRLVKGAGSRWINIAGYALSATVFCYSNTLGVLLPAAFFIAGLLIVYLDSKALDNADSKSSLKLEDIFLTVAAPFFAMLPWVPNVLMQARQPLGIAPGGILNSPLIFAYNLVMMIPLPLWMGILIVAGLVLVMAIRLIKALILNRNVSGSGVSFGFVQKIPRHLLVLIFAVAVPASFVGVVTPFSIGYFRYVVPFSPAGWVLVAFFVERLIEAISSRGKLSHSTLTILFASFFFLSDVWYVILFDQRHQSGLRGMARAVEAGDFDNSVIIVGPDQPACTLSYYLSEEKRSKHNVVLRGFVRWHADNPVPVPDLDPLWNDKSASNNAIKNLDKLTGKGYKFLVLATDKHYMKNLKTRKMKSQVEDFVGKIEQKWGKPVKTARFKGLVENVKVSVYKFE